MFAWRPCALGSVVVLDYTGGMVVSGGPVRGGDRVQAGGVAARVARDRAARTAVLAALVLAACSASHPPSEPFVGTGAMSGAGASGAQGAAGWGAAGAAGFPAGPPDGTRPPPPMECRSGLLASRCLGPMLRICRSDGSFEDRRCSRDANCVDVPGRAACVCREGTVGDGFTCRDLDECATGTALCSDLATCVNLLGGYACGSCPPGYDDPRGDGGVCVDIDECATDNGGCDPLVTCFNTDGGHVCGSCPPDHLDQGTLGCVPGLVDFHVSPGEVWPGFDTQTTSYSVNVPVLTETVGVNATTVPGASIAVGGERFASLASWTSPPLTIGGSDAFEFEVSDAAQASAVYTLWVQRSAWPAYLKGYPTHGGDAFGHRIAISADVLVASAPFAAQSGTVHVFENSEDERWRPMQEITGDAVAAGDRFGHSIAVGERVIVVGAAFDDGGGAVGSGAVYVFEREDELASWTQTAYLKASNPGADDQFGHSVALSGDTLVIGAPYEDGPAEALSDSGAAYVFVRDGSDWTQRAYLKASNAGNGDGFGAGVALHHETLVVAAPLEDGGSPGVNGTQADESAQDSGAAYVFTGANDSWTQQA